MIRSAVVATSFAALLTMSAAAQEPHASTSTTPDTPVSVTENKNIQQQTGNGTADTTDTKDSQKSLEHQEKSAKQQAKQNKEEAKAAKAQRKALKAQDKANKEAMKTK